MPDTRPITRWLRGLFGRRDVVPPETRALCDAVVDWRKDGSPASAEAMTEALRAATLFAPVPADRATGTDAIVARLQTGGAAPPLGLGEVDGKRCWAVFTDPSAARAAFPVDTRSVPIPAVDVLKCAAHNALALVIDPRIDGRPRLIISAERTAPLAAGLIPDGRGGWRAGPGLRYRVVVPDPAPTDGLCAALGLIARREPAVDTAHLFDMAFAGDARAAAIGLTLAHGISQNGRSAALSRVQAHLDALFRGGVTPTLVIVDEGMSSAVFDRSVPLFIRDGLGGTGIVVPDGHTVGLLLPAARPEVIELGSHVLLVDIGPDADDLEDTLDRARTRLGADPKPVLWVIQRTAVMALAARPREETRLWATMAALSDLGNRMIRQSAVVSAETSAGRHLARRLGELGVRVHALGPTREIAVEIRGPDGIRIGLPGRHLAGPESEVQA